MKHTTAKMIAEEYQRSGTGFGRPGIHVRDGEFFGRYTQSENALLTHFLQWYEEEYGPFEVTNA